MNKSFRDLIYIDIINLFLQFTTLLTIYGSLSKTGYVFCFLQANGLYMKREKMMFINLTFLCVFYKSDITFYLHPKKRMPLSIVSYALKILKENQSNAFIYKTDTFFVLVMLPKGYSCTYKTIILEESCP